ncbi:hypothetical protein WA026_004261 [Henosepilachna vigintioctopunctata]|uniref:Uncharacterized protein n=1 Tax=Henosepilachna vigintioctopunctata TaxID=420089 RepID=A0AAW1V9J2_9CUCU
MTSRAAKIVQLAVKHELLCLPKYESTKEVENNDAETEVDNSDQKNESSESEYLPDNNGTTEDDSFEISSFVTPKSSETTSSLRNNFDTKGNSHTEQEASDNDDDDSIPLSGIQRQMYSSVRRSNQHNSSDAETSDHELLMSTYSGKDDTIWRKQPFRQNVRIRSENIINFAPRVQYVAKCT